jgi:hypothetical protein
MGLMFHEGDPSNQEHQESRAVMISKQGGNTSCHHIKIAEQEIQYLTDKIKRSERQTNFLTHLKNDNNSHHDILLPAEKCQTITSEKW